MWKCPICSKENEKEGICEVCGFDERTDFVGRRTVCRVPLEDLLSRRRYDPDASVLRKNDSEKKQIEVTISNEIRQYWILLAIIPIALVVWGKVYIAFLPRVSAWQRNSMVVNSLTDVFFGCIFSTLVYSLWKCSRKFNIIWQIVFAASILWSTIDYSINMNAIIYKLILVFVPGLLCLGITLILQKILSNRLHNESFGMWICVIVTTLGIWLINRPLFVFCYGSLNYAGGRFLPRISSVFDCVLWVIAGLVTCHLLKVLLPEKNKADRGNSEAEQYGILLAVIPIGSLIVTVLYDILLVIMYKNSLAYGLMITCYTSFYAIYTGTVCGSLVYSLWKRTKKFNIIWQVICIAVQLLMFLSYDAGILYNGFLGDLAISTAVSMLLACGVNIILKKGLCSKVKRNTGMIFCVCFTVIISMVVLNWLGPMFLNHHGYKYLYAIWFVFNIAASLAGLRCFDRFLSNKMAVSEE